MYGLNGVLCVTALFCELVDAVCKLVDAVCKLVDAVCKLHSQSADCTILQTVSMHVFAFCRMHITFCRMIMHTCTVCKL